MRSCSLCGGKLDNNKRCTFCGLDNTKNDDMYKHLLSQNDCKHAPLSHVHEEPVKKTYAKSYSKPKNTYSSAQYNSAKRTKSKKTESKGVLASLVSVITIIGALVGVVSSIVEEYNYQSHEEIYMEEEYNPYEYVSDNMPVEGDFYETALEPGIYKVGMDIPMGIYEAELLTGDYGYVEINDSWNSIFFSENLEAEVQEFVSDLRLYDGAYLVVSSNITVNLYTKNAQELITKGEANLLTESVVLKDERIVAGEDFEAGVYNVAYQPSEEYEYGYVEYIISEEGYDYQWSIYLDSDQGEQTYHNIVLPEGAEIFLEDLEMVTLVPSERIESTEYDEFYENYY